jgi:hypothetical protein
MEEKALSDDISKLMSDTPAMEPPSVEEETAEQQDILAEALKAVAGQSDEKLETALEDFLSGRGVLSEASQTALTRSGSTGLSEVITLLMKQFKLSPAVAKMIASLIVKLQSSASQETTAKKKPRRKSKPKAATSAKKKPAAKKAKKKAAAKAQKTKPKTAAKKKPASSARKPKKTASKAAAKKKTAAKTGKKKATARITKKATRASA